ncbi:MAG: tRNA pseudouridine(38-40) synthase TruA [Spirochaetaceae bacterium]|jgi:tRNA pseudouridine38-40 synthase|nr:tRNA pseudouridine(38-40) synthase TruA [Spirochaetaceae bacterium]
MRNIKLKIAYDGTDFCGWQRQSSANMGAKGPFNPSAKKNTVQEVLEEALSRLHKKYTPASGAGRTDSGVHARGQTANFFTDIKSIKDASFIPALNSILPPDVRITDSAEVPASFHARFDAKMRFYRYFLICGKDASPHDARFALNLRDRTPDIRLLNEYCRFLRGECDCSLFASAKDGAFKKGSGSKRRFIRQCYFFMEKGRLVFEVAANAFFWKMVRSMLGTFLFYEEKQTPPLEFQKILARGDHSKAGPTAPPNGLFFWNVEY